MDIQNNVFIFKFFIFISCLHSNSFSFKVICFLAIDVCRLIYCSGIQNFIVNTSLYCQNTLSMHSNFWIGIDMNWHAGMTIYIMYAYKITENVTE